MNNILLNIIFIVTCYCLIGCSTAKYMYGVSQLKDFNTGELKNTQKEHVYPDLSKSQDNPENKKIARLLIGHNYRDIEEDSVVIDCGTVELPHYNMDYADFDGQKLHYQRDWVSYKGHSLVFYRTFDDSEDGGNTFGFVTDEYGNKICYIDDSNLVLEKP